MTRERIKELKGIASHLYMTVLDEMRAHKWGYVENEIERTVVLGELSRKVTTVMNNLLYENLTKGDEGED